MTFCSKIFVCWSFQLQIGMGGLNDIQWTCQLQLQSVRLAAACCLALPTFSRLRTLPVISRANADTSKRCQRSPLHTAICVQGQVFSRSRDAINACTLLCTICKITMSPAGTSGSHWDLTSSQNNAAMASALLLERQDPIGSLHGMKTTLWQVLCLW